MNAAALVSSFRMYNAGPRAAAAWRALFGRVFDELGLEARILEHRWPQPIASLWEEPALCCAFMCGWPYTLSGRMQAIAAPVPSPPRYEGLPRYCSEFLARGASGWTSIEQSFGHRCGWMSADSQSGFNGPRAHLSRFISASRPALFSEVVGPLGNPAKSLEALATGQVDVIAIDSFYLDLVRRHEPASLAGLATLGTTEWAPIPLLVAAPAVDCGIVERLRERLTTLHAQPRYLPLLGDVLVARFADADPAAYARLEESAQRSIASGYRDIR